MVNTSIASLNSEDLRDFVSLEEIKITREFLNKLPKELREEGQREFIDIGGPTLIRASAKNFYRVAVVVDPQDYAWVANKIRKAPLALKIGKNWP